ncbi:MAG: DUF3306 domain-containing protein [Pseudomonadota bacterium]
MSNEPFLARWSRRKQGTKAGLAEPACEQPVDAQGPAPADREVAEPAPPAADLATLPPIETIDAATDVTAFLRKGIPQELSRAALRRAWSADPAIRDFVGLAENAWDFTDPAAMPGFGPLDLSAEQVAALVNRVVGNVGSLMQAAETVTGAPSDTVDLSAMTIEDATRSAPAAPGSASASQPVEALAGARSSDEPAAAEQPTDSAAPQPPVSRDVTSATSALRRRHGGALPH